MDVLTFMLVKWWMGENSLNGEPTLVLQLSNGRTVGVQMPGVTAMEMGAALMGAGDKAMPPIGTKPN